MLRVAEKAVFASAQNCRGALHLSYFNGAKAKKFRDWRRVENKQIRLTIALTGIKMTVGPVFMGSSVGRQAQRTAFSRGKREAAGCPACS